MGFFPALIVLGLIVVFLFLVVVARSSERTAGTSRGFTVHVAGVSHRSQDGRDRQAMIRACRAGQPVRLVAQPDNPVDCNAVAVVTQTGDQIGYLPANLARITAEKRDLALLRASIKSIDEMDSGQLGVLLRVDRTQGGA